MTARHGAEAMSNVIIAPNISDAAPVTSGWPPLNGSAAETGTHAGKERIFRFIRRPTKMPAMNGAIALPTVNAVICRLDAA